MSSLDRPLLAIVSDLAGDRDHARTRQFADLLANQSHPQQITELVALLGIRDKAIQRAAAHLVGEVSDHNPNLFLPHLDTLVACVRSGSGPVVWESLHVLVQVAVANPRAVEPYLETFIAAVDGPSIVARDHAVRILARLASIKEIRSRVLAA
ncbi:MAG TPA: hypothetical protein PK819_12665, partial [Thermomicrobiales bacterium]|nr:hypothetical protein [Thermomicrobiales bacterium]